MKTGIKNIRPRIAMIMPLRVRSFREPSDQHYNTPEHARWRKTIIKRAHGMCEALGCYRTGVRLFADHVIELKDGGDLLSLDNGQALCGSCHTIKTARARAARNARIIPPANASSTSFYHRNEAKRERDSAGSVVGTGKDGGRPV